MPQLLHKHLQPCGLHFQACPLPSQRCAHEEVATEGCMGDPEDNW